MNLEGLEKRIAALENRALSGDMLGLVCAAMRRTHAQITGQPHPVSKFDSRLDSLERTADPGRDAEPLLEVAWGILQPTSETINSKEAEC